MEGRGGQPGREDARRDIEVERLLRRNYGPPQDDSPAHGVSSGAAADVSSGAESLEPSSGFAAAVMERVRVEAQAPGPIRFPWRRALPGLCMAALALAVGTALLGVMVRTGARLLAAMVVASAASGSTGPLDRLAEGAGKMHLGWLTASLLIALVPLGLTRLLGGRHLR
jgi:hypothetical protein